MGLLALISGVYAVVSLTLGLRRKRRLQRIVNEAAHASQESRESQAIQAATSDQSTGILPALLLRPRAPRQRGE